jgi:hypothetical protein
MPFSPPFDFGDDAFASIAFRRSIGFQRWLAPQLNFGDDEVKVMSLDLNYDALKDLGANLTVGVREGVSDLSLSNRTSGAFTGLGNLADSVWVGVSAFGRGGPFGHQWELLDHDGFIVSRFLPDAITPCHYLQPGPFLRVISPRPSDSSASSAVFGLAAPMRLVLFFFFVFGTWPF